MASVFMFFRGGVEGGDVGQSGEDAVASAAITMRLVSGADDEGLECGASLWMVAEDGARSLTADPNRTCVDGHLLWEGLAGGDYRVMTRAAGFLDGDFEVTVESAVVDLGPHALALAASLGGVVIDANGPVSDVRILLSDGQATTSSESGEFSFRNVPVGQVELRASAVGMRTEQTFELPQEGMSGVSVELREAPQRGLLGLRCDLADCGCEISALLPGSPAAEALSVGDCFSAVNGESVVGVPRNTIGSKLSGEVGDIIALTVSGEQLELTLGAPVTFRPAR
jgi:hypothetical protein